MNSSATPDPTGDTVGAVTSYTADGTNSDQSTYVTDLTMTVTGQTLAVRWEFEGADENYVGIGVFTGPGRWASGAVRSAGVSNRRNNGIFILSDNRTTCGQVSAEREARLPNRTIAG